MTWSILYNVCPQAWIVKPFSYAEFVFNGLSLSFVWVWQQQKSVPPQRLGPIPDARQILFSSQC